MNQLPAAFTNIKIAKTIAQRLEDKKSWIARKSPVGHTYAGRTYKWEISPYSLFKSLECTHPIFRSVLGAISAEVGNRHHKFVDKPITQKSKCDCRNYIIVYLQEILTEPTLMESIESEHLEAINILRKQVKLKRLTKVVEKTYKTKDVKEFLLKNKFNVRTFSAVRIFELSPYLKKAYQIKREWLKENIYIFRVELASSKKIPLLMTTLSEQFKVLRCNKKHLGYNYDTSRHLIIDMSK